jgi:uncharacterized Ntn-hydrolase superfamily protein
MLSRVRDPEPVEAGVSSGIGLNRRAISKALRIPLLLCLSAALLHAADPEVHTFSIVAFDPATGELGVAVESKYFGVGSVVPWAKAGVGAVATQARAHMSFGPEGLTLMEGGKSPRAAMDLLLAADPGAAERQVAFIDVKGRTAAHTGKECLAFAGHREGSNYSVQGNLLAGEGVLNSMAEAFEAARKKEGTELADWLLAALQAGQAAGGDRRGQQSAALLVVRAGGGPGGDNDRYMDLRVEDNPAPIDELARLRALHAKFYGPVREPGK